MLIEDVEKLIKQLQEEQAMTQEEARKEAFRRTLEDMDNDYEVEPRFDRPLSGCPAPLFRRIIDKFGKGGKSDDFEF